MNDGGETDDSLMKLVVEYLESLSTTASLTSSLADTGKCCLGA